MRKCLFKFAILLLLGAIINVAVALALWFKGERPARKTVDSVDHWDSEFASLDEIEMWKNWSSAEWPDPPDHSLRQQKLGMHYTLMIATIHGFDPSSLTSEEWAAKARQRKFFRLESVQLGLPLTTVRMEQAIETSGLPPIHTSRRNGWQAGSIAIPNRIAWPGFAINTIFYAAIGWALFAVPGMIRKRVRCTRGQCAACGYSLRGRGTSGTVCPECGATA